MTELPLVEKYRPVDFNEVVNTTDIETIKKLIESPTNMPSLLFYGPQGTGKSTIAKLIINKLKPIDVLRINGSDTTGVDTIRDKVYNFMISMSSVQDKPKLIWIEEFDFMSASAYAALRAMMEQYMKNARFIVTCNYLNKIPEPILSRFTPFEFTKPKDFQEAEARLKFICDTEHIEYDSKSNIFIELVNYYSGDLRSCINHIQKSGEKIYTLTTEVDIVKQVYELLLTKQWSKIRYDICSQSPDYVNILVQLDEMFFKDEKVDLVKKAEINLIIADGLAVYNDSFNKNILFSAICYKIIKAIN